MLPPNFYKGSSVAINSRHALLYIRIPGDKCRDQCNICSLAREALFVTAAVGKPALCKQELGYLSKVLFLLVNLLPFLKMEMIIHLHSHILNHTSLICIKFVSINKLYCHLSILSEGGI